jgi:hypothetical protein
MINALGLSNEGKFNFVDTPGIKYEWLEDTYAPIEDALSAAIDNAVTTIPVVTGAAFQAGDVFQIDDEYFWVVSVSANNLTVATRGWGGTAAASHLISAPIYIRYGSRLEGSAAGDSAYTEATSEYNYSFIMQKTIEVSRTSQLLKRYGIASVVDREIDKAMDELTLKLTKLPYYGKRVIGGAGVARSAGGLDHFIVTNVTDVAAAALTQKHIEDAVVASFVAGGSPSLLVCNTWPKRKMADWFGGYVETTREERMGGIEISRILTPIGITLSVLVDRWCPANKLYILDPAHVGYITLDEFFHEDLGKKGDTADGGYGQVVGEYGFALRFQKAHAVIKNFSVTL